MLKQDPNVVLPDHCLPKIEALIQSRRQARIITTAPCLRMKRKKRESKSWKINGPE